MAKCDRVVERVPMEVAPQFTYVVRYQLTLSQDEAETLMILTHTVGGSEYGRRKHNTSIQHALLDAGIREQGLHPDRANGDAIYFKDTITAR